MTFLPKKKGNKMSKNKIQDDCYREDSCEFMEECGSSTADLKSTKTYKKV